METNTIRVFFDELGYPFKDSELSVRYPIIGSAFLGASNTTEIRFYYSKLGDENTTWVSVAKLPNGKQGSKVLDLSEDDFGKYASLELSNWYSQAKGDVFIALQGYQGGVDYEYDSDEGLYVIHGTPTIQTTGSIKLAINYAPIGQVADYNDEYSTYQEILAGLGEKLNITSGIISVNNSSDINPSVYDDGQMFYVKTKRHMYILSSGNIISMNDYLDFQSSNSSGTLTSTERDILGANNAFVVFNHQTFVRMTRSGNDIYFSNSVECDTLGDEFDTLYYKVLSINVLSGAWTYNELDFDFETHNVVALDSLGTLTTSQFNTLNKFPSIILYNNVAYLHCEDDTTYLYFKRLDKEEFEYDNSTHTYRFEDRYLKVLKSTRSVSSTINANNFYNYLWTNQTFATSLDLTIDSNYDLVVKLLNANGQVISQDDIDLPLESIVVSATYYDTYTYEGTTYNNVLVIVLATTSVPTIVPLGDLVSGLVSSDELATALANYYTKTQTDALLSGKQDTLTFDDTPTTSSNNPVKSGGIKSYVDNGLLTKFDYCVALDPATINDFVGVIPTSPYRSAAIIEWRKTSGSSTYHAGTYLVYYARMGNLLYCMAISLEATNANRYYFISGNYAGNTNISAFFSDTYRHTFANESDIARVLEVAEGKCKTYILSYADTYSTVSADLQANPSKTIVNESGTDITSAFLTDTDSAYSDYVINAQFNSQNDYVGTGLTDPTYCYIIIKKIIDNQLDLSGDYILCKVDFTTPENTKIKVGDLLLVVETSIPDRWFANISDTQLFYKLETGAANGYAKNEDLIPAANNTYDIGSSSYTFKDIYSQGIVNTSEIDFRYQGTSTVAKWSFRPDNDYGFSLKRENSFILNFVTTQGLSTDYTFFPMNIGKDLGKSSSHWREGFIDKITDTNGSYSSDNVFNVINASDIVNNTLTQAQYDLITNGKPTLIKGTLLGMTNILVCGLQDFITTIRGVAIWGREINSLMITVSTKVVSSGGQDINLPRVGSINLTTINGKSTDYYLNNVYPYATNSTTTLQYETINNISVSADTTFTLATAPSNTYPEYKANITNTDTSNAITITLPVGTVIKGNVSISSNTFEIPADSSVEINIQNGRCLVMNWGA